jgi:hypothetical protein
VLEAMNVTLSATPATATGTAKDKAATTGKTPAKKAPAKKVLARKKSSAKKSTAA